MLNERSIFVLSGIFLTAVATGAKKGGREERVATTPSPQPEIEAKSDRQALVPLAAEGAVEPEKVGEEKVGEKNGKKPSWKEQVEKLHLDRQGLVSDILWGKIPPEIQDAAGGKMRPRYFKWPVLGGRFGRGFGSGKKGKHKALDIVAPAGTPVLAASSGLVVWADDKNGYGKTIIILHPGGWVTLYAHLSRYFVSRGKRVKTRQKIGAVGSTGISRGPHLHFMFFDNGVLRDPAPLIHPSIPHPPRVPPMPYMGHKVEKGQTVEKIAALYGVDPLALLESNGIREGQPLQPGWRIIIPKKIGQKKFKKGFYTVKKGDTLSSIAILYDVSVKELLALNNIGDASLLQPGMKIKLPEGVYDGKAMSGLGGDEEMSLRSARKMYVVKKGDNLFSIAEKCDTSISNIVAINNITDPNRLKPGMKIQIPVANPPGKGGKEGKVKKPKRMAGGKRPVPEELISEPESPPAFEIVTEEDLDLRSIENFKEENGTKATEMTDGEN